jgi:uncharacterized membrane protein YhaH (DUF805 family)
VQQLSSRFGAGARGGALVSALVTIVAAYASVHFGATVGAGSVVVLAIFLGTVLTYLAAPHIALAGTIALFSVVPALKVFAGSQVGGVKDVVCLAAFSAAALLCFIDKRWPDRYVGYLVLILLGLYVLDVGGGHGAAWAQGVRLTGEPLLLLLVGWTLPNPRRNLRYALGALLIPGCIVAFYGLLQQGLGGATLVSLGYSYNDQVRNVSGLLRSFGTFDDPFGYASYLTFAIAVLIFWRRRDALTWPIGALLLLGLTVSYVRTAALFLVAFAALILLRGRQIVPALAFVTAIAVVAVLSLGAAGGSQTNAYPVLTKGGGSQLVNRPVGSVVLNGRVSAWKAALGDKPQDWILGRGVGKVGTAAARASYSITPSTTTSTTSASSSNVAVDSGYLATMADVGIVGLLVQLALFWRLLSLGAKAARAGDRAGWVALALMSSMMLDALTRASFTGFPTAFVGLLLVSTALAAASSDDEGGDAGRSSSAPRHGRSPQPAGPRGLERLGPPQQLAP